MIQNACSWCTGMTQKNGMGKEQGRGSGWGTRVPPWQIHVDVWQNQYNIVKLIEKYYVGSRYLELKFLKIPFTIAPKNEIPNYTSNIICTYVCLEDDETVWEKVK